MVPDNFFSGGRCSGRITSVRRRWFSRRIREIPVQPNYSVRRQYARIVRSKKNVLKSTRTRSLLQRTLYGIPTAAAWNVIRSDRASYNHKIIAHCYHGRGERSTIFLIANDSTALQPRSLDRGATDRPRKAAKIVSNLTRDIAVLRRRYRAVFGRN